MQLSVEMNKKSTKYEDGDGDRKVDGASPFKSKKWWYEKFNEAYIYEQ